MSLPSQTPLGSPTLPSQSEIDKIVSNYFIKKGYNASTQENLSLDQLLQQFKSSNQGILKSSIEEEGVENIQSSYESLREWVMNGLDIYKVYTCAYCYNLMLSSFSLRLNYKNCYTQCLCIFFLSS